MQKWIKKLKKKTNDIITLHHRQLLMFQALEAEKAWEWRWTGSISHLLATFDQHQFKLTANVTLWIIVNGHKVAYDVATPTDVKIYRFIHKEIDPPESKSNFVLP